MATVENNKTNLNELSQFIQKQNVEYQLLQNKDTPEAKDFRKRIDEATTLGNQLRLTGGRTSPTGTTAVKDAMQRVNDARVAAAKRDLGSGDTQVPAELQPKPTTPRAKEGKFKANNAKWDDVQGGKAQLKKGDKGAAVEQLQRALAAGGYFPGDTGIDGKWGPRTQAAWDKFVKDNPQAGKGKMHEAIKLLQARKIAI